MKKKLQINLIASLFYHQQFIFVCVKMNVGVCATYFENHWKYRSQGIGSLFSLDNS